MGYRCCALSFPHVVFCPPPTTPTAATSVATTEPTVCPPSIQCRHTHRTKERERKRKKRKKGWKCNCFLPFFIPSFPPYLKHRLDEGRESVQERSAVLNVGLLSSSFLFDKKNPKHGERRKTNQRRGQKKTAAAVVPLVFTPHSLRLFPAFFHPRLSSSPAVAEWYSSRRRGFIFLWWSHKAHFCMDSVCT